MSAASEFMFKMDGGGKKENRRKHKDDISIRIRLSAEQKKRLEDLAYAARKNVSEYVRDALGLSETTQ